MATIFDVAEKAGVGVGTVSRVLNGSPLVSKDTRARVQAVIDELDYEPSTLARGLSSGRSTTVAVVAPFFTRPSVVERLRGVVEVLSETDYDVVLFNVETVDQRDRRFRTLSQRGRAAGTVVISLQPSEAALDRLQGREVPAVFIDREIEGYPHLVIDDIAGGRLATRHLLDLGHRRVAFVGDVDDSDFEFVAGARRLEGYRQAMAQAGQELDPALVRLGPHGREVAHQLTRELLDLDEPPTAIFAVSDTQALGVLEAARAAGVEVPGHLSVIGYDDIETSAYVGLTTVRQPLYESGVRGTRKLLDLLAGRDVDQREDLPLEVIVRSTTAPAA